VSGVSIAAILGFLAAFAVLVVLYVILRYNEPPQSSLRHRKEDSAVVWRFHRRKSLREDADGGSD